MALSRIFIQKLYKVEATNGDVTIDAGSTFEIISLAGDTVFDQTYTVIATTALNDLLGAVNGEFSNLINPFTLVDPLLIYTANSVLLDIFPLAFSILGFTGNAKAVADYLDEIEIVPGSDLGHIVDSLRLLREIDPIEEALLQMQPSQLKGLALTQESAYIQLRKSLRHRLEDPCSSPMCCPQVWLGISGDVLRQRKMGGQVGDEVPFDGQSIFATLGVDYQRPCTRFGGAISYSHSWVKWDSNRGKGQINSGYASLYGKWEGDTFFVQGALTGSYNHYDPERRLKFTIVDRKAKSSFGGGLGAAYLSGGMMFCGGPFGFIPYIGADISYMSQGSFQESGADSLNLKVGRTEYGLFRGEVGARFELCICCWYQKVGIQVDLAYGREERFKGKGYRAHFQRYKESFNVVGFRPDRNLFLPGISITAKSPDELNSFSLGYRAEVGTAYRDHSFFLEAQKVF